MLFVWADILNYVRVHLGKRLLSIFGLLCYLMGYNLRKVLFRRIECHIRLEFLFAFLGQV